MPLTGKFIADFSDFDRAVQKSEGELRTLEFGAGRVESALNRMSVSLGDRKLITDAMQITDLVERMGGISRLTAAELERVGTITGDAVTKMKAMGIEVPPGLHRIAEATASIEPPTNRATTGMMALGTAIGSFIGSFAYNLIQQGVSSLIQLGKEAFTSAGHIVDLSQKTGLSTTAIQQMQFVADQTGGSLEGFTKAALQLGVRLSGGGASVVAGVRELGLSFDVIKAMKMEDQWNLVTAALEKMENPQQRNRIELALFGKTGQEALSAITEGYTTLASQAPLSSEAQIRALEKAGDAWDAFVSRVKTGIRSWLGDMVLANDNWRKMTNDQKDFYIDLQAGADKTAASQFLLNQRFEDIVLPAEHATAAIIPYVQQLADARKEMSLLEAADLAELAAAKELGVTVQELVDHFGVSTAAITMAIDAQKKLKEETTKAAEAYHKLISEALNAEGLAQMNEAAATIARAAKNAEGIWLMERDAWQLAFAARQKAAAEEQAIADQRQKDWDTWFQSMGNGLAIIGQVKDASASMGAEHTAQVDAMTGSWHRLGLEAAAALKLMVPPGFSFTNAYREAGLFVHDVSPTLLNKSNLGSAGSWNAPINIVNNIVDTADNLARRVSDGLTAAVLQGRKVSA